MALLIVLVLLALILVGTGFAVHILWWGLIILLIVGLIAAFGRRPGSRV